MNKHVPADFKPSALGPIPIRWEVRKLHEIATINDGAHQTPTYTEKGKPFLRVTDIQSQNIDFASIKYIPENEHYELTKRCKPEKGDILLSKNGTIGIVKVVTWNWDFSIFVSLALIKIIKKDCIHLWYLSKVLESPSIRLQIKERAKQGTVTNLHLEEIREFDILIPPLPEQRKIAAVLSSADRSIAATEKLIAKLADLKKALMQQLLTKGIGHTEFKPSPLGPIPKSWEVLKLEAISTKISDGIHTTPEYSIGTEFFFINGNNLDESKITIDEKTKCVSLGEYIKHKRILDSNTILLSINGTIGNLAYYRNEKVILGKSAAYINLKEDMCKEYIYYFLHSESVAKYFQYELTGTTISNLSLLSVKNTYVAFPPLPEQRMIADILSTVDRKLSAAKVKLAKAKDLKQGLMNDLLTGEVRVSA